MAQASAIKKPTEQQIARVTYRRVITQENLDQTALLVRCNQRLQALDQTRLSWWRTWRPLARWINPRLARFLETANENTRGRLHNRRIINSTALTASQRFSAGLLAGVASPARPWFKVRIVANDNAQQNPAVKAWLDEVTKRMLRVFAESNFYRALATMLEQIGVFGTGVMIMYEDFKDIIRCVPIATGEYYSAVDHRLETTTLARKFAMTLEEIVGEFGLESLPDDLQQSYRNGSLSQEQMIGHLIMPNDDRVWDAKGAMGRPFVEVYWLLGANAGKALEVTGYHERPFMTGRWNVTGNDAYGHGPGDDALGDVIQLQITEKRKGQFIEKMVNPPVVADAVLEGKATSTTPGAVTFIPPGQNGVGFKSVYDMKPEGLSALKEDISETEQRIKTVFFEDLFLMISQMEGVQPRQNMEIMERKEEKMLMLGPPLERLHDEVLRLCVKRLYAIMNRNKLLPPCPAQLHGKSIEIEFVSILAQAQKATALTAIERLFAFAGNIAGTKPEIMDKLDADEALEQYADILGAPSTIIVSADAVAKIRAARAKQAQVDAGVQTGTAGAMAAKNLSETNVGGGQNALQKITGMAA